VFFTDRYEVLGIPYPDPDTKCLGDCEGTGWVPIFADEEDPVYLELWKKAEEEWPQADGWHFVRCPACGGTGKRPQLSS